jgi:iron-sulfur cluster repair protein YtfE (RIC family)
MAKRHPALVPLARDHYHGLLLAVRLQQGEQALLHLWSHDPLWQARYVTSFYDEELAHHFSVEETNLFPLVRNQLPSTRPVISELVTEHAAISRAVESFRRPDSANLREDLAAFGKLLESHIRKEDRILFPMIEESAPAYVLAKLERDVTARYAHRGAPGTTPDGEPS